MATPDTTNIRELASLLSTVIGTVEKGSTFRVIDRSKDGKWLKIETHDGSSRYQWAALGKRAVGNTLDAAHLPLLGARHRERDQLAENPATSAAYGEERVAASV